MTTKIDRKLYEKMLKILSVVRRGVDGEKEAAELLLNQMLERTGLTIEELEGTIKRRGFKISNKDQQRLVGQVLYALFPDKDAYTIKGCRNAVFIDLSEAEFIEAGQMINFHLDKYNREWRKLLAETKNTFHLAFVHHHNLFPVDAPAGKGKSRTMTPEEVEELHRVMRQLDDNKYRKPLDRGYKH